jgi:hypothetical protein
VRIARLPVALIRQSLLLVRDELSHSPRAGQLIDEVVALLDPAPSAEALRKRKSRAKSRGQSADKAQDSHSDSHADSHVTPLPVTLPLTTATSSQDQDQEPIADLNSSFFSSNAGAHARSNIGSETVSAAWHAHAKHYMLLHAHSSRRWRTAYETIATAVNAVAANLDRVPRETLDELMTWWWKSSAGPIGSGRVVGAFATPETLADKVSTDLSHALGLLRDARASGTTVSPKVIALREARDAYEAAQKRGDEPEVLRLEQQLEKLGREFSHG